VTVTATNLCPPNCEGGWCDPPNQHFDMSQPAWLQIAVYKGGIVPVLYQRCSFMLPTKSLDGLTEISQRDWPISLFLRRALCVKQGGVWFTINGHSYFELVLITNVSGSWSVKSVWAKGSKTNRMVMSRNWGVNWQWLADLEGQPHLWGGVTSTGGQTIVFPDVVPAWWKFGQSFSSSIHFTD
jgi:hypothetical protein